MAESSSTAFAEVLLQKITKIPPRTVFLSQLPSRLRMVITHEQEPVPDSDRGSLLPAAVGRGQEVGKTTIRT